VCRPQSRKRRQDLALSPDNYCMYVMNLDDGILQGGMTCMIGFDRAYEPLIDTCDRHLRHFGASCRIEALTR
jgi:hypothetical protein